MFLDDHDEIHGLVRNQPKMGGYVMLVLSCYKTMTTASTEALTYIGTYRCMVHDKTKSELMVNCRIRREKKI